VVAEDAAVHAWEDCWVALLLVKNQMRKGYDFSKGKRAKHVGKRIRIVGDNADFLVIPKGTLSKYFKVLTPQEVQELDVRSQTTPTASDPDEEYCNAIRALSTQVHHWMMRQPAVGEESITDWLLFEVSERLPRVRYYKFNRFEEARISGADWDWWFVGNRVSMGWRVQAKKLKKDADNYADIARANRFGLQVEKLLESSDADNLLPFYSLYYAPKGTPRVKCKGDIGMATDDGVFLAGARTVYESFILKGRVKIDPDSVLAVANPLYCLFCCPMGLNHDGAVEGLYRYLQEYHSDVLGSAEVNQNQRAGLHDELPAHVRSLLETPVGEMTESYEREFSRLAQQTGAVLVFDLRE
jgi:hypothetical protein